MTTTLQNYNPIFRKYNSSDLKDIVSTEEAVSDFPWEADHIQKFCERKGNTIYVVRVESVIVGYAFVEVGDYIYKIIKMIAHPKFGDQIYEFIINKFKKLAKEDGKTQVHTYVPEDNLEVQLFFQRMGFRAIETKQRMFRQSGTDNPIDGYLFEYDLTVAPKEEI